MLSLVLRMIVGEELLCCREILILRQVFIHGVLQPDLQQVRRQLMLVSRHVASLCRASFDLSNPKFFLRSRRIRKTHLQWSPVIFNSSLFVFRGVTLIVGDAYVLDRTISSWPVTHLICRTDHTLPNHFDFSRLVLTTSMLFICTHRFHASKYSASGPPFLPPFFPPFLTRLELRNPPKSILPFLKSLNDLTHLCVRVTPDYYGRGEFRLHNQHINRRLLSHLKNLKCLKELELELVDEKGFANQNLEDLFTESVCLFPPDLVSLSLIRRSEKFPIPLPRHLGHTLQLPSSLVSLTLHDLMFTLATPLPPLLSSIHLMTPFSQYFSPVPEKVEALDAMTHYHYLHSRLIPSPV